MILYFVRHGETDWNVKKKIQGKTDVPLNETGKQQAKSLRTCFWNRKKEGTLQVVRASYIPTASCRHRRHRRRRSALDIPCIAAVVCGNGYGRLGRQKAGKALRRKMQKSIRTGNANRRYVHTPHGECYNEVLRRALDTLGMILERETEDVLIVTHSGVLMALRCYIAGQAFEEMGIIRYKTKNCRGG